MSDIMDVFPSFWRLENRSVIVVGGADAAIRKLRLLARTPARIAVFADSPADEISALEAEGRITLHRRALTETDIADDVAFAIVATEHDDIAEQSVDLLRAARIPVNAVDRTELCDFLIPSIVDRNPVVIGIATGGAAPILARNVRETLEALLPARLGNLAAFARKFRGAVSATLSDGKARKAFWEGFFTGPVAQQVLNGDEAGANDAMLTALNRRASSHRPLGAVTLIEVDADATDLLSLRALRHMQRADVILHRADAAAGLLELTRRDADRAEWTRAGHAVETAARHAEQGLSVVVLGPSGSLPETRYETLRHGAVPDRRPAALAAV
ncbi:MAG: NAD(P)-dependent oxidoreductase [Pseudomonadota bacterium]|nr:NAD(P)-dependent oxidoreductase [Pseudomonadota bacterium]